MPNCVCCGSKDVVHVGAIPDAKNFAGRQLSTPLQGGDLFTCHACRLVFRYPRLDKVALDELYSLGNSEYFQEPIEARRDWRIARQWITRYLKHDSSILDVGCFDGGFLRAVGLQYRRFGIEINEAASAAACACGINLVSKDFASMPKNESKYDLVTSFDVIEHTHDPLGFLSTLAGITRQNGLVIISTGNSNALSWKIVGSRYWYCVIGDHLVFINPTWCTWAAPRLGLELKQVVTYSHSNANWLKRVVDTGKNLLFSVFPRIFVELRKRGFYKGKIDQLNEPPYWGSAKDHCIFLFEKK